MDRRNFLVVASLLPVISNAAKATDVPKLQANPNQKILKLKYMPPCGDTLSSITVRSSSDKYDIDIDTSTKENLPNKIKKILKDLKQRYPNHRFIFENNDMIYNRDEYDELAETTLRDLVKLSGQSHRELLLQLSKPS